MIGGTIFGRDDVSRKSLASDFVGILAGYCLNCCISVLLMHVIRPPPR